MCFKDKKTTLFKACLNKKQFNCCNLTAKLLIINRIESVENLVLLKIYTFNNFLNY